MIRRTPALFAAPLLACAPLLVNASAAAQDLAPPSTGDSSSAGTTSATSQTGTAKPEGTKPEDKKLESDEKKDSGRGLEWVYLNADAGFSYINMASLSMSNLVPTSTAGSLVQNTSSSGPVFGVGAGVRIFVVTLGARASLNELSSFNLWQLDAELGFHIPLGHWDPYFGLHGGYCFVGALGEGITGLTSGSQSPSISITGGDAGAHLGIDYYFNHFVSLGLDVSASFLFLSRPPPTLSPTQMAALSAVGELSNYEKSGDSVGFGVAPSLHLGFHL